MTRKHFAFCAKSYIGSKRLHVNFEIPAYKFAYMGKAGGR